MRISNGALCDVVSRQVVRLFVISMMSCLQPFFALVAFLNSSTVSFVVSLISAVHFMCGLPLFRLPPLIPIIIDFHKRSSSPRMICQTMTASVLRLVRVVGVFKDRLLRLLGAFYISATIASTGDTTIHVRSQLAIMCRCSSQHSLTQNITHTGTHIKF